MQKYIPNMSPLSTATEADILKPAEASAQPSAVTPGAGSPETPLEWPASNG